MSSESTSPTASPSTETPDSSPPPPSSTSPPPPPSTTSPPPPSTTSPPPPSKTPPPSTPAATPPPSDPSSSPPPPNSPPPAPPTSSPPPPSSTPPPATPDTSESPPPPASTSPPSPPAATPSPPAPVDAAPTLPNSPPTTPAFSPPQAQEKPVPASETPRPPSQLSHNPTRSGAGSRSSESSSSSGDQPSIDGGVIAGIVVGGVVIIALLMVIICLMCRNKKKRKPQYYMDPGRQPNGTNQYYNQDPAQWHSAPAPGPPNQGGNGGGGWGSTHMQGHANTSGEFSSHPMPPSTNMGGIHQFSYEELASATGGFCEANLLGQGGFGLVHKGILPDRREVAVKSLKSGSGQGEREFQAEVEIISRVHHRHLVSLVGYCIAGDNKLLVYEFVANKTMEFHLHGKGQPVLDWPTRLRIAIGSAKGLAYLHEDCLPRIIHRDIKAANILIDNNYEAMVADFGLAKLTTDNNTHISTRVMGTFGYLAPEYASSGKLSEKSDVFSFGVMLLELVTGRRPIDLTNITMEDSLVDWARPLLAKALEDGNYEQLVDPGLEGKYLHQELARMAACAAASIRHSARKRPKMSQIVRALEGDSSLEDLNEGVKPGQSAMYNPNGSGTTEVYDTRAYNADMMQFKKMVMSTQEFNSGESGSTSEYGLNPSLSTDADSTEMERKPFDVNKS